MDTEEVFQELYYAGVSWKHDPQANMVVPGKKRLSRIPWKKSPRHIKVLSACREPRRASPSCRRPVGEEHAICRR